MKLKENQQILYHYLTYLSDALSSVLYNPEHEPDEAYFTEKLSQLRNIIDDILDVPGSNNSDTFLLALNKFLSKQTYQTSFISTLPVLIMQSDKTVEGYEAAIKAAFIIANEVEQKLQEME